MIYGIVLATLYEWVVWVATTEPIFDAGDDGTGSGRVPNWAAQFGLPRQ